MKKICAPQAAHLGIMVVLSIVPSLTWAGVIAKNTLLRHYEPVVLNGRTLPVFTEANVKHLLAYVYFDTLKQWVQIPCQIDERNPSGSYYNADDSLWDNNDELVFMAKDLGDRVSANTWIDDEESRSYPRYEITVTDPLDLTKQAWVYLYRSSTLLDTNTVDYISYDKDADRISTQHYILGHNANGVPVDLIIPTTGGGNGQDIMDRQKTRVRGTYRYGFITHDYTLTEQNLEKKRIDCRDGDVRVIRTIFLDLVITVPLLGEIRRQVDFTTRYYLYNSAFGGGTGTITSEYGVSQIRQSNDLNVKATNMVLYNPLNSEVLIDGILDDVNPSLTVPGINWVLITGNQGSIVYLVKMQAIGTTRQLYYWDRVPTGTSPGRTPDTGEDGNSYGDTGVLIQGTNITGTFSFENLTYYLPANQDSVMGATLANYYANPLAVGTETQMYDGITPAAIVLNTVEMGETYIKLSWTAPGDDGTTGGPVQSYDLRYSPSPVDGDTASWWQGATRIDDEPTPAQPGTEQNYTVNGLTRNTTYYFGMIAEDDAGNQSSLTQLTSAVTVPIELLSFSASIDGGIVTLYWATTSETNSYGFEVQRSSGDKTDFRKIGFVLGAGTTTELHSYNFTDNNVPSGTHYYRLKQIDTDGSFQYSEPIKVKVTTPLSFALEQNYPNPFNAETEIHYQVARTGRVTIKIYNLLAQEIRTLIDEEKDAGYYTAYWDARDDNGDAVASGIYFYQMRSGNFFQLRKMILLR